MKTFIQVAVYILLVAALGAVAFYVYMFVQNGQHDFYVRYGEEKISGEKSVELCKDGWSFFSCEKVLSFGDASEASNFTVSVEFNPSVDNGIKDFKVGDKYKSIDKEQPDFSEVFNLQVTDNGFRLYFPSSFKTMKDTFEAYYSGQSVSEFPEIILSNDYYFRLVVFEKSENVTVYIPFK